MIRPADQFEAPVIDQIPQFSDFFKRLADSTRMRILELLQQEGELHVRALSSTLELSQPLVSHHLGLLREAGIVKMRRSGKNNFYSVVNGRIEEMFEGFLESLAAAAQPETVSAAADSQQSAPVEPLVASASA